MTVRLSDNIIKPLHPIASAKQLQGVEDIIITSGRAGSKSSGQSFNVDMRAIKQPSAHVIMRKTHNKIGSTVFKEATRALSRLGVRSRAYQTWTRPYKIRIKKNGSMIYFAGSDNPDDTKGMIDDNFPIETVTVDEVNEFFKMGYDRGVEELDNIKATFVRGNDSDFKMFYMFNPPKNPHAPVMQWLEKKKYIHDEEGNRLVLNPRTLHIHVTYLDVPVHWNGKALYESAEETKRLDEEYYRWLWLGECIGVKDVIYHMFKESTHIKEYDGEPLYNLGIGVDYGQMNATAFIAGGISRKDKTLKLVKEYVHSGRDTGKQKTPSEYAQDMYDFVLQIEEETKSRVNFVTIDPSALGFAEEVKRVFNDNGRKIPIRPAQNSVAEGITRTQNLLYNEALILNKGLTGTVKEFGIYAYDERSIERGDEKPLKVNDHNMDALRYLVMEQYDILKPYLKVKE